MQPISSVLHIKHQIVAIRSEEITFRHSSDGSPGVSYGIEGQDFPCAPAQHRFG
jgi:hypothetical protein